MAVEAGCSALRIRHRLEGDKGKPARTASVQILRKVNSADGSKSRAQHSNVLVGDDIREIGDADGVRLLRSLHGAASGIGGGLTGPLTGRHVLATANRTVLALQGHGLDLLPGSLLLEGLLEGTGSSPMGAITITTGNILQVYFSGLLVNKILFDICSQRELQEHILTINGRSTIGTRLVASCSSKLCPFLKQYEYKNLN